MSKCFLLRLWKKGSEMRGEDVTTTTNWRWVTDDANFARLKADKVFWFVIALARVVNALRFVQMPLLDSEGKDSPSAVRARLNSFFFGCSLFYEASLFVQGLPGPYRTMAEFQSMAAIINGKDARNLRDSNLDNLRNKLVFHFDVEEIGKRVQTLQHPVFLTATGKANSEVYYEIADACTFVAFKEVSATTDPGSRDLVERVTDVILAFVDAAELFIKAYLEKEGWGGEVVSQPHYTRTADDITTPS
ncbi:MAG: hypothetical protein WA847_13255 [Terriglobales bacterium]